MKRRFLMLTFVMLAAVQSYGAAAAPALLPFEKEGVELGLTHDEIAEIQRGAPVSEVTTLANFYNSVLYYFQERVIHGLRDWVTEQISNMTSKGGDSELKGQRIATFVKALRDKEAEKKEPELRQTPRKLGEDRLGLFEQQQSGTAQGSPAAAATKAKRTPPPTRPKPGSSPSLPRSGLAGAPATPSVTDSVKKKSPPVAPKKSKEPVTQAVSAAPAPVAALPQATEEPAHPGSAVEVVAAEENLVRKAVAEELSGAQVAQHQAQELLERNAQILADVSSGTVVASHNVILVDDDDGVTLLRKPVAVVVGDDDDEVVILRRPPEGDDDDDAVMILSARPAVRSGGERVEGGGKDDTLSGAAGAGVPMQQQVVTEGFPSAASSVGVVVEQRTEGAGEGVTALRRSSHEVRERLRRGIFAAAAAEREKRAAQAEVDKIQALQDLQGALRSRYDLETAERRNIGDLASDQALQLLQDPEFQDESLQPKIKQLMSAPDGTFDKTVVQEALEKENDDFKRFVTDLAFSSKTSDERFKTDFKRFERVLLELLRTEQVEPVLKLLVERHEPFLKEKLKSLQKREHSPHLTDEQIKEWLIGQVRDGLGYSPSDQALTAFVPVLLALQESMRVPTSSPTLDALFKKAGPTIRGSGTGQASAPQTPTKQGIDAIAHRLGFSMIVIQIGNVESTIRQEMNKILKEEKEKGFEPDICTLAASWIEQAQSNSRPEGSASPLVKLTSEEKDLLENKIVELCTKN